jgi:hydroxymethylbilane synthase
VSPQPLRLGSRRSPMAISQSGGVARLITEGTGRLVELVGVTTLGDVSKAQLTQIGGTGVFVSALRESLLRGEVDFVVHSLKDLPTGAAPGITLAAKLADLPSGARIGTGSPRRAAQLGLLRSDITCVPIRGNANTRLAKVRDGELDAVVLAYAGLARIGHTELVTEIFEPDDMVPAPGQGALAVECRRDDTELAGLLARIDHQATRDAVTAERSLLAALGVGCSAPVGAFAFRGGDPPYPPGHVRWKSEDIGHADGGRLILQAVVLGVPAVNPQPGVLDVAPPSMTVSIGGATPRTPRVMSDGKANISDITMVVRERGEADAVDAARLGRELAARMLTLGAADLMSAKIDGEDAHD